MFSLSVKKGENSRENFNLSPLRGWLGLTSCSSFNFCHRIHRFSKGQKTEVLSPDIRKPEILSLLSFERQIFNVCIIILLIHQSLKCVRAFMLWSLSRLTLTLFSIEKTNSAARFVGEIQKWSCFFWELSVCAKTIPSKAKNTIDLLQALNFTSLWTTCSRPVVNKLLHVMPTHPDIGSKMVPYGGYEVL